MESIQFQWRRIETWLSRHAPHAWQSLLPGASEKEIQQAEITLGITLPEDFKASWRLHNGGYLIDLVTEMRIFSLNEIIAEWQMFQELEEMETWDDAGVPYYFTEFVVHSGWQTGAIQPVWWHQCWIPFGRDRAGNNCCLDLCPPVGGLWDRLSIEITKRDHPVFWLSAFLRCFPRLLMTWRLENMRIRRGAWSTFLIIDHTNVDVDYVLYCEMGQVQFISHL